MYTSVIQPAALVILKGYKSSLANRGELDLNQCPNSSESPSQNDSTVLTDSATICSAVDHGHRTWKLINTL